MSALGTRRGLSAIAAQALPDLAVALDVGSRRTSRNVRRPETFGVHQVRESAPGVDPMMEWIGPSRGGARTRSPMNLHGHGRPNLRQAYSQVEQLLAQHRRDLTAIHAPVRPRRRTTHEDEGAARAAGPPGGASERIDGETQPAPAVTSTGCRQRAAAAAYARVCSRPGTTRRPRTRTMNRCRLLHTDQGPVAVTAELAELHSAATSPDLPALSVRRIEQDDGLLGRSEVIPKTAEDRTSSVRMPRTPRSSRDAWTSLTPSRPASSSSA